LVRVSLPNGACIAVLLLRLVLLALQRWIVH
jgi:hypothetical protein